MKQELKINDVLSIKDKTCNNVPLRGVIEISRHNKLTGETEFLHRGENVITISGYQYILEKIFNLYMDSSHNNGYERRDRDTNLVMSDLNESMRIGKMIQDYSVMTTNIAENHFIQGFMVGNGGSGEDAITSKNTHYSFVNLRNPIPFQQTQTTLSGDKAGKYVGVSRDSDSMRSYYIKKFDETPHIYHSWWKDSQSWDYVDPVSADNLGPNSQNPRTQDRIETYAECKLSIDDTDFKSYFDHNSQATSTKFINELGLVSFDIAGGERTEIQNMYNDKIYPLLNMLFDKKIGASQSSVINIKIENYASEIYTTISNSESDLASNSHIANFLSCMSIAKSGALDVSDQSTLTDIRNSLSSPDNIGVEALYNQNDDLMYVTDNFMTYIDSDVEFTTEDEAERIRLITYYTFNAIPVERNWELLINYRIYAN